MRDRVLSYLYNNHYTIIEKYILSNSGTKADTADTFQDAIVILYQNVRANKFQLQSSIGTYLYAVARNIWLKKLRKGRVDTSKMELEESYSFDDEKIIQSSQLTIRDALEQIGDTCKRLLLDFYFHKKSMMMLTHAYGLGSNEATRNKKYRCMQRLIAFVQEKKLNRGDFIDE